jgi:hypothetical protein
MYPGGWNYNISWLLEIIAYCAVDCYAIISGYVCYSEEHKPHYYKRFLSFWVQVCTYSFGITLLVYIIRPEIGIRTLITCLFPITRLHYWYVSAYAGLFL